MDNLLDNFRLRKEKEDFQTIVANIENGVSFRGTNLWILIFAIFIACLGLNVNSTAVIIGAMLISPLMGPIMGIGLSLGINDLSLMRKSLFNYFFAAGIGLIASSIYFSLTPLNEAHSEILARTSPNIYDVLIAFFGGLAGILATSSRQKGNVIPGVAIATALMPPLCTAGYGIATLQPYYFIGALYLFFINTVFIALAALITSRLLKFPFKQLPEKKEGLRSNRIVWAVVLVTLLPSIYFGYTTVEESKFTKNTTRFINAEAIFPNDYLLQKVIEPKNKSITLTYGGKLITDSQITQLKRRLKDYYIDNATLNVRQGFSYLNENDQNKVIKPLNEALVEKEKELQSMKTSIDSMNGKKLFEQQLIKETKAIYPPFTRLSISPIVTAARKGDTLQTELVYMEFSILPNPSEKKQLDDWLATKFTQRIKVVFDK